MKADTDILKGNAGAKLFVRSWSRDEEPKGILHILHGMAEHSGRYIDFAQYLVKNGYYVYAHDHRLHGKSIREEQVFGIFGKDDTWENVVDDVRIVNQFIRKQHPNSNIFVLGHSMGSVICRDYLQDNGDSVKGAIIMGSPTPNTLLSYIALGLSKIMSIFFRNSKRNVALNKLFVGNFNKLCNSSRTHCDWLTKDNGIVDNYINDILCGYPYSTEFYKQFSRGLLHANKEKYIVKGYKIPLLFISGVEDAVGDNGESVRHLYEKYKESGYHQIEKYLVKEARHEVLNELNRNETYKYLLDWLESHN